MKATKGHLIGRKIVSVEWRYFSDGKGGRTTDPVLVLDNGRRVFFNVQETDVGEYGVRIGVSDKRPIGAKTQK